jgi:hypothetical protein
MSSKPEKIIPDHQDIQSLLIEYVNQLSIIEKKVLQIAKEHLETSFSLETSIGFIKWLKNKPK